MLRKLNSEIKRSLGFIIFVLYFYKLSWTTYSNPIVLPLCFQWLKSGNTMCYICSSRVWPQSQDKETKCWIIEGTVCLWQHLHCSLHIVHYQWILKHSFHWSSWIAVTVIDYYSSRKVGCLVNKNEMATLETLSPRRRVVVPCASDCLLAFN